MRTFIVSAYYGEQNKQHKQETITATTPHQAAKKFVADLTPDSTVELFPLRQEQPFSRDGKLFSVWSAGWSGSGQRIYIKEQIGGF